MLQPRYPILSFDGLTLDLRRGCLLGREGEDVKLRPKSFEVLTYLVENSGRLIAKEELIGSVWSDTAVTDDSLVQCLIEVRRALGDHGQRLVKTVPRRGYIFQAEVTVTQLADQESQSTGEAERPDVTLDTAAPSDDKICFAESPALQWGRRNSPLRAAMMALSCAGVVLVGIVLGSARHRIDPGERSPGPIRSIAVLPLENLSGDPAQGYFADGMTESLITNLTRIRALKVISRTSVMRYKGSNKPLPDIARELNVDAVIEGSVQRSGGRVRITAKLIPATSDSPLWAHEYERDLSDVLKLQSEIARAVTNEIRVDVTAEEGARLGSARSIDPAAHEAYLQGQYHNSIGDDQGWTEAIEYFKHAIQLAPDYAAAYAGLANAWHYRGTYGANSKEVESPARAAALRAIELDDQLAEPHISLGIIKHNYDWNWAGAEHEFRRALTLDPGSVLAHISYGHLLMHVGRHNDAIREGQIAVQLDPLSSPTQASLGRFLYRARQYEEAVQRLKRAVELEPRSIGANYRLGDLLAHIGKHQEAMMAFERIGQVAPGDFQVGIARVYALMGRQREARQMISGLRANADAIAAVYTALGDHDEAFRILEKAVAERQNIVSLKVDPPLEKLHSDPRWQALLKQMNYPR